MHRLQSLATAHVWQVSHVAYTQFSIQGELCAFLHFTSMQDLINCSQSFLSVVDNKMYVAELD